MGIGGAALGMVFGYLIATVYLCTYFFNSKRTLKLIKIKFDKSVKYMVDICKTGFPSSSIALYQAIKLAIINFIILGVMANVGLVAFNMCCNTALLVSIFIFGTSQSLLPIVTVYFQERDYNGVEYVARKSLKIVVAFGIFFTALFTLFPQTILVIFSVSDPSHISSVMNAVRIFSSCLLAYSINFLYIFYIQSIQNMKLANILTLLNGLVFPVIFVFIFSIIWKENGIWFAFVVSEIPTLLVIYLYSIYLNKKTHGEYSGFFLKKRHEENEKMLEYTIHADENDALYLSKQVRDFLRDEKTAEYVSLAMKELIMYILEINDKLDWIDVIVRDSDKSTIISIKHSGIGYNPQTDTELNSKHIDNLISISDNIDYSQILGLNNTVISIKK